MTSDGNIVGMSYPVRMNELPTYRQEEIRERFGQSHVAEIRVVWEQGKPEYYEVQVDRNGEIEKVALDTVSEVKVAFNN